ncbi:hypothetical protein N9N67_01280 [Bacteriovoracaceae bacterium]|nr:hypothetical protein [Bacteriovoracaceae bacterium]
MLKIILLLIFSLFTFNLFSNAELKNQICSAINSEQSSLTISKAICLEGKVHSDLDSNKNNLYGYSFPLNPSSIIICQIDLDNPIVTDDTYEEDDEERVSTCNSYYVPGKNIISQEEKINFCEQLTEDNKDFQLSDHNLSKEKCLSSPMFIKPTNFEHVKFISILYIQFPKLGDYWSHSSYFDLKNKKFVRKSKQIQSHFRTFIKNLPVLLKGK